MIHRSTLLAFGLAAASVLPSRAANHTVTATPGNTFQPSNLTIQAGDTVTWVNGGGFHNVAAQDSSFRCAQGCDGQGGDGDPSSAAWSFTLTFPDPGTTNYRCEVHFGLGMVGRIEVEADDPPPPPPPEPEPGLLRFSTSSVSTMEGSAAAVTVRRVSGSDGQVSADVATQDDSAVAGADYQSLSATLTWADGNNDPQTVQISGLQDDLVEGDESFRVLLSAPTGGAGLGSPSSTTVTVLDDDTVPAGCVPDDTTHCLNQGRFQVRVHWRDFQDREGMGQRIDLTADSGLFWFFSDQNVEILVKVLDACGFQPYDDYWVFVASATNVEYTIEVIDTVTGEKQLYPNPLGRRAPAVADTGHFKDSCP